MVSIRAMESLLKMASVSATVSINNRTRYILLTLLKSQRSIILINILRFVQLVKKKKKKINVECKLMNLITKSLHYICLYYFFNNIIVLYNCIYNICGTIIIMQLKYISVRYMRQ